MEELGQGLAEIGQGALTARAVEPYREGGETDGHTHETACLNCDTELVGPHCHVCGQTAHVHRTLGAFFHDLLHGVLHFEGKSWRTLRMLALRPGKLTREYIEGKRARYVSPMAVFLFSIFVMFAVVQVTSHSEGMPEPVTVDQAVSVDEIKERYEDQKAVTLDQLRDRFEARRDEAEAAVEAAAPGSPERAAAEKRLAEVSAELEDVNDAVKVGSIKGADVAVFKSGYDWFDQKVVKKWQDNPKLMIYKLQSNGYKFSWLLIPLSLPFMWLLFFWKRGIGLYDHTVFVTYSIAFMSLLFIVVSVVAMLGAPESVLVALSTIVPLGHIFVHMKGTYGLRTFSTLWREGMLFFMIQFVIVLFFVAIALLGVMG